MKKLTKEQFVEKASTKHNYKYQYPLVVYANSTTKVTITCPDHGNFSQTPGNHMNGAGCPECGRITNREALLSNKEEFIENANKKHNYKYQYPRVIYKKSSVKVIITCPEHGDFEQTPNAHLMGSGCPKCAAIAISESKLSNTEEFIENANKKHNYKYQYPRTKYVGTETKVIITCPEHGDFEQTPHNHLYGYGCNACAQELKSKKSMGTKEEFIESANKMHNFFYDYSLVDYQGNKVKVKIICPDHGIFEQIPNNHLCGAGCPECAKAIFISSQEHYIMDNLKVENIEQSNRSILNGREIDIYFPDNKLGIEVNGLYWHSDIAPQPKDKKYHKQKTDECEQQGIQLIHFWDKEINDIPDIVMSVINSKLGITETKIHGRKCVVKEVDVDVAKQFLTDNHMQGSGAIGSLRYGLYYLDELVSLMTFGKSRFNKDYEWELIRFCNKLNTIVVGGASKLFKYANLTSVVSYANRRWSNGNLYKQLGFDFLHTSEPNYFYIKGNKLLTRNQCQKHKLPKLLGDDFNPNETEVENMRRCEYGMIYDCGNMVFGFKR